MLCLLVFIIFTDVMLQMLYENIEKEQESFEKKNISNSHKKTQMHIS